MTTFGTAAEVLREAVGTRAFPAAAVEVGSRERDRLAGVVRHLSRTTPSAGGQRRYDLRSRLTHQGDRTTTLVMRAVDDGLLRLEDPVSAWIPEWRGSDRADVTVRDLLAHVRD